MCLKLLFDIILSEERNNLRILVGIFSLLKELIQ